MVIHYYKQFFPGPNAVGPRQPRELARCLAERGHRVHVVTNDFNAYSEATEPTEAHEAGGGGFWEVHRVATPRRMRASLGARLRTYLSFAARAVPLGLRLERPDVVIASIQPLFAGLAGRTVAGARRAPFVLEVRDLWPDALEAKGAITTWEARPLHAIANHLYRRAARIVSLTPGIKKELVHKGIAADRIDVFPNGFDPGMFRLDDAVRLRTRERYGWGDDFVALYAGTHTEVTAVDVIVRAAAALRDTAGVRVVLFGQGQTKAAAVALAGQLGLANIEFHDPVPKVDVPAVLAGADAGLMTLFESRLTHIYFENKLMDYMGAGLPILAAMGGEQARIIRAFDTGRVVPAYDHEGLAASIRDAAEGRLPIATLGDNGRRLVRERFALPDILVRYVRVVERVAQDRADELRAWEPTT